MSVLLLATCSSDDDAPADPPIGDKADRPETTDQLEFDDETLGLPLRAATLTTIPPAQTSGQLQHRGGGCIYFVSESPDALVLWPGGSQLILDGDEVQVELGDLVVAVGGEAQLHPGGFVPFSSDLVADGGPPCEVGEGQSVFVYAGDG